MAILSEELKNWNDERAYAVMIRRRLDAITGANSICTPAVTDAPYYPFTDMSYPYTDRLGMLYQPPWVDILKVPPADLIPIDPFTPSVLRPEGLQVWDAAIGIPAPALRQPNVIKLRMVPSIRNTNTLWSSTTVPALGRVGPLGLNGEFVRPAGPYIFDLMNHPLGWRILDGAHALAHRFADTIPVIRKNKAYATSPTYTHPQRITFQMVACLTYGLPFDTWRLNDDNSSMQSIAQYGINLYPSSYFRAPTLTVPVITTDACRPDTVIACLAGGVYIEPHPHGFTTETQHWKEVNRWSCSPTMCVIAGWELMDVVTHQTLCAIDPADKRNPVCYGMNPSDLQSPDTFWAYLQYAVKHRGLPKVDNKRYWFVEDWLTSKDYANAINEAPPLPCRDCLRLNMRTEGAPQRPQSRPPDRVRTKTELLAIRAGTLRVSQTEQDWLDWEAQLQSILGLIQQATQYYEGRIYGHSEAARMRKRKIAGYKTRLKEVREIMRLTKAIEKAKKDGFPSHIPALQEQREALIIATNERLK